MSHNQLTIHTTPLYTRVGCPLLLTSVYNEIVLLGLLICDYHSYNVLMCTGWLPLAAYQRT
jgi:hypothetical protein